MNKSTKIGCLILNGLCSQIALGQQSIDAYITDSTKNSYVLVASSTNSLSSPVDLDFYPNQSQRPFQLWILNQGTESTGGSTVIINDANKTSRTSKYVKDGNAWHFMSMASALAFGDSLWGTSADVLDANHKTGRYTGPTLWPSDLTVYGIVGNPSSQTINGSHLDMIHQSPYGKGIAFERDLVYWVLDGYEGNLKRYDYVRTHQPGGSDHSAGAVRVYNDFSFTKHASLPSHIVIDAERKYLYGCDPVGRRVFRVDITTGSDNGVASKINSEPLASYEDYTGLSFKDVVTTNLTNPVGIDIYGNRLIVTDNGTDEIVIYDVSNNYKEIGRIKLKYVISPDPMGIKIGPDGKIYFVDKANKRAYMIDNSAVLPLATNNVSNAQNILDFFPNPTQNSLTITFKSEIKSGEIKLLNVYGETVFFKAISNADNTTLDVSSFSNGIYFVQIETNNQLFIQKIIKQ